MSKNIKKEEYNSTILKGLKELNKTPINREVTFINENKLGKVETETEDSKNFSEIQDQVEIIRTFVNDTRHKARDNGYKLDIGSKGFHDAIKTVALHDLEEEIIDVLLNKCFSIENTKNQNKLVKYKKAPKAIKNEFNNLHKRIANSEKMIKKILEINVVDAELVDSDHDDEVNFIN